MLDETAACEERLNVAMHVARQFEAHLVGLFAVGFPYIPAYAEAQIPAEVYEQRRKAVDVARARVKDGFERATQSAGISLEWRTVEGDQLNEIDLHVRYADLAVVGQENPASSGALGTASDLAENLVLGCGRPVLTVPYVGKYPKVGGRVMVAWDAGREAAGAVADSLPFLRRADSVVTLSVNPRSGDEAGSHGEMPGADIASHLARHGVKVEAQTIHSKDVSVANMILHDFDEWLKPIFLIQTFPHVQPAPGFSIRIGVFIHVDDRVL